MVRAQAENKFLLWKEYWISLVKMVTVLRPINYGPSAEDIYISASQHQTFSLRNGDKVAGKARPPKESERLWFDARGKRYWKRSGKSEEANYVRPALTPLYPQRQLQLETTPQRLSTE